MKSSIITPLQRKYFYKQEVSVLVIFIGCFIAACGIPVSSPEPSRAPIEPAVTATNPVEAVLESTNLTETISKPTNTASVSPTTEPSPTDVIPTIQVGGIAFPDPRFDPVSKKFFDKKDAIVGGMKYSPPIPLLVNALRKAGIANEDGTEISVEQVIGDLVFNLEQDKMGNSFICGSFWINQDISTEIGLKAGQIPIIIGGVNNEGVIVWQESTARVLADKNHIVVGATAHYPVWGDELGRNMAPFLARHFNGLTLEQHYAWKHVEKAQGSSPNNGRVLEVSSVIRFAKTYNMKITGRPVIYNEHYPNWLKEGGFTRDQLLSFVDKRLRDTVGRFPEIYLWELLNEQHDIKFGWHGDALQASGLGMNELALYIFQKAIDMNPDARFMFTDNTNETLASINFPYMLAKINFLINNGIPADRILVGIQGHLKGNDLPGYNKFLQGAEAYPVKKLFTEVDINMKDVPISNPKREIIQAKGYVDVIRACLNTDCEGIYLWDPGDSGSWLEHPSQIGQRYYSPNADATPFYDDLSPKISYYAMMAALLESLQK